ncbi:cytochrome P450 302a1, mitochondrial-like isoform X3 [Haemaphysalis longicornis]
MRRIPRRLLAALPRASGRPNSSLATAAAEKPCPVEQHDVCPVHKADTLLENAMSRPVGTTSTARPFEEIPGPKPLPLVGNIWRYLPLIGEMDLTRMHRNAQRLLDQYGPLVREVVVGDRVVVHVFDPRDMEHVFRNEGRFPARLSHRALLKYRRERPDVYGSGGLFPSNGEEWHRLRHTFQKPLMQQGAMSAYMDVLQEVTWDVANLVRQTRDSKTLEMEDFLKELYRWALECTGVLALNTRLGCLERDLSSDSERQRLVEAASETHRIIMVTENGLPFWKVWNTPAYRKLVDSQDFMASIVNKYLERAIAAMRQGTAGERTVLEKFVTTPGIDIKDVFTMILDMFLAGIDTTAYSTTFILYYLATNPHCQDRLARELRTLLPAQDSKLSLEQLQGAAYLRACIRESLRLSPIAIGVGRVLPDGIVLSGYNIPAGTVLIMHNQVACRQASSYPEPDAYRPERWLKEERPDAGRAHPFTLLPFGYGPRMCIGKRFAETVMCLLVARVVRNFVLEYKHEKLDCFTRLINVPDKPLKMTFIDRDS